MTDMSPETRASTYALLLKLLGPEVVRLMEPTRGSEAPPVEDLFLNAGDPDGPVFARYAGRKERLAVRLGPDTMLTVINYAGRLIGMDADGVRSFTVSGKLPGGQRFHGVVPPRAANGPYAVIRIPSRRVLTIGDYVGNGVMSPEVGEQLARDVEDARTVVIAGPTGAGKTSLLTCLLNTGRARRSRVALLEDAAEVNVNALDDVIVKSTLGGTMAELAYDVLRERPDIVVIGEVRDGALWVWVKVVRTGHPGSMVTIHADGPAGAMVRAEQLVSEAVPDATAQRAVLCDAVDRIVVVRLRPDGRREVPGVYEPIGHDGRGYVIRTVAGMPFV